MKYLLAHLWPHLAILALAPLFSCPYLVGHVETQTMQTADCRLQTADCRLQTVQTRQIVQNVQTECYVFTLH